MDIPNTVLGAVEMAHRLRINPGGEVVGLRVPGKDHDRILPPIEGRNRLLTEGEIDGAKLEILDAVVRKAMKDAEGLEFPGL